MFKNKLKAPLAVIAVIFIASACVRPQVVPLPAQGPEISIVPKPLQLERQAGSFHLASAAIIAVPANNEGAAGAADYLAGRLKTAFGLGPRVSADPVPEGKTAVVLFPSAKTSLGDEGYELKIAPDGIRIGANGPGGFFYGVQTLLQLLPAEAFSSNFAAVVPPVVPCVTIEDKPRLAWRGMLLDCSRHFFPKAFIKRYIDYLAYHKMNTFHWHITDDQGWRLEIKKYPKLTEVGAWRVDREDKDWSDRPAQGPGDKATLGGFYTQEDVKEIVAYAKSRCVNVVPEIEMPGHCLAALAAYPEYSCKGGPFTVPPGGVWPIKDVYCPGNEGTFAFLEDILSEVVDLFPSPYIHIGGDEVDKSTWKECPKCQARIQAEGLKDEAELQSYFVRRIEKFLNSKGKKLIGWDEILEGGLAPNAAVMSWRGTEGGIAAARARHTVVMTPTTHMYFDYYQGDPALEPPGIGGNLPLSTVYSFEPVAPELGADEAPFIIGVQANLWAEYVPTPSHAEYMTFPRIAATAEIGWSAKEGKDWNDFLGRLVKQFQRYDKMGVNYARSVYAVKINPVFDEASKTMKIGLANESFRPEIRYTLDGSEPTAASAYYDKPFELTKSAAVKAGTFAGPVRLGPVTATKFLAHQALGKPLALVFPFSPKNPAGGPLALVDGMRGGPSQSDGRWQGFEGDDLIAVIDLGAERELRTIKTGFFQNTGSWVFWPRSVEFAVSSDGKDYRVLGLIPGGDTDRQTGVMFKDVGVEAKGAKARFVRVTAKSIGVCPEGHPGAGQKAWLFADEIIVD